MNGSLVQIIVRFSKKSDFGTCSLLVFVTFIQTLKKACALKHVCEIPFLNPL